MRIRLTRSAPRRARGHSRLRRLAAGIGIWGLALAVPVVAQQIAYLPTFTGGTVVVFDADTNTIVATLTGFNDPIGVAVTADGSEAWVTEYCTGGGVRVIETATNTVAASIPTALCAWTVAFTADGSRAYVSHQAGPDIAVIDTAARTVVGTVAGTAGSTGMVRSPDGSRLYAARPIGGGSGLIHVIDTATHTLATSFATGRAFDVEVSPDGTRLYVMDWDVHGSGGILALDAATGASLGSVATGRGYNIALTADGATLYVPSFASNTIHVVDTATLTITSSFLAPAVSPRGIALTPDQSTLLLTHANGTGDSALVDAGTLAVTTGPLLGGFPHVVGNPFRPGALNKAPNCSAAAPSVTSLWPANGRMVPVSVGGITDPDGDAVTVTVQSIFQDEPTNGPGDGNTPFDGTGVGTATAQVRAERSGRGNGRVYHVTVLAKDGKGGSCSAVVKVSVPFSMGRNGAAVDGGALFDSTLP